MTACAIASVGALAPGRVVLGLGTGNSARRAMGMPPYRVTQLRESVRWCADCSEAARWIIAKAS